MSASLSVCLSVCHVFLRVPITSPLLSFITLPFSLLLPPLLGQAHWQRYRFTVVTTGTSVDRAWNEGNRALQRYQV